MATKAKRKAVEEVKAVRSRDSLLVMLSTLSVECRFASRQFPAILTAVEMPALALTKTAEKSHLFLQSILTRGYLLYIRRPCRYPSISFRARENSTSMKEAKVSRIRFQGAELRPEFPKKVRNREIIMQRSINPTLECSPCARSCATPITRRELNVELYR